MELHSQQVRALAPESDPLKIGMGWTIDDLSKPQIMVESTFGDSHPGSAHLDQFVRQAVQAVNEHGGKAARYFATDLCDGIAQGHDGINYSLAHREAIVDLVEAQANASGFDGGIFIASCDKAVPAMLMSIGRLKEMSAIVVTGGVMEAHPLPEEYTVQDPACAINELLTLEQIGKFDAWEKTGVISSQQLRYYKHNACPSCGACSFMGTASTMQIMAEALGLMLPGTALMPATAPELKKAAYDAGVQLLKLVERGIRAQDIVTKESFENAVMVHAAISGSTNATMHLPAIAHEFGIEIDADTFDRMHRGAHYLLNIRPSGDWPAQYFYYAGGVPRVMEEIRSMLHLGAMTVTGKTLGENLDALARMPLWVHGLDYNHGTGHGVGFILSVHEGPQSFRCRSLDGRRIVLEEGMVISNEPGYYAAGKFGIRHENLMLVRTGEATDYGQFLYLEPLTMVPFDRDAIDTALLTEEELARLNDYHRLVYDTVSPLLPAEEQAWLAQATAPLQR